MKSCSVVSTPQWPCVSALCSDAHSLAANSCTTKLAALSAHTESMRFVRKTLRLFSVHNYPGSISEPREHYVFFFACVWTVRFGGCRPKWPLRFLRNALADTPLHSAESHQLCREPARTEGEDSSNNMATTAVSPQSLPHLQSCYGFPDSL